MMAHRKPRRVRSSNQRTMTVRIIDSWDRRSRSITAYVGGLVDLDDFTVAIEAHLRKRYSVTSVHDARHKRR